MKDLVIEEQKRWIHFSDDRLRQRYHLSMSYLSEGNSSQSFPSLIKDPYELKGFYRFINNTRVSQATFINGYEQGLVSYSKQQEEQECGWYLIHDTMYVEYNSRQLDLGYTQTINSNGFLLHHGLLLDNNQVPLGLLHQGVIHRERADYGKRDNCTKKPIEDKESSKWLEGIQSGQKFTQQTSRRLIHLMDREGDIGEVINYFLQNDSAKSGFIIRARHDRSTLTHSQRDREENVRLFRLFSSIKQSPHSKKIIRTLRNKKGKSYSAECLLRYEHYQFRGIVNPVGCVHLQEVSPSEESKITEWYLLTNLTLDNFQQAEAIIETYTRRWIIEDFHKCYKTGCSIEQRQFDSRESLCTAIGFLALPAIQLLRSRYYARINPEASFEILVTQKDAQELARKAARKYLMPVDLTVAKEGTVLWWLLLLGRMGGHQGYKSKGLPGWQTLWKGLNYFNVLLEGYLSNTSP